MSSAAAALRYWERRQEVAANNLANVETSGFKAERVFARMIDDVLPVADTVTDMRSGTLRPTGGSLDLALDGEGFFVVQTPQGERYTRGGAFRLDAEGRIVDANGNALLGTEPDAGARNRGADDAPAGAQSRPITVTGGTLEIGRDGTVKVDGQPVARVRVEREPEGVRPAHAGANLWIPSGAGQPVGTGDPMVRQGMIEESNVGTIDSMVDMISIQRAYQTVQKAVTTLDDVRRTIVNDLGKST
jgi:flagellar basal-body rod protein FlgF